MSERLSPPDAGKGRAESGESSAAELARLARVYDGYQSSGRSAKRWRPEQPGNRAILQERDRKVRGLLESSPIGPLRDRKVLDVGCGAGEVLAGLRRWGATADHLHGVDVRPDRVANARQTFPGLHFHVANAEQLSFDDGHFDLVLLFTLFSSILDPRMAANVAREVNRVLARPGALLWYDMRYDNPRNPHVRGIGRREIERLFPGYEGRFQTLTLLPPLARRLGPLTRYLYPPLAALPTLRTHFLALLKAPSEA